jgi:hypothetical protein
MPGRGSVRLLLLLFIPVLLLLPASDAYSQGVGRVLGKVLDAGTGKPLPFANIVILDTQFGAVSAEDGEYIIVGIPPGVYSVRASLIGYTGVVRKDVRVVADQAARANFELQQVAVGGKDEVIIWSTRPMVEVDVASTKRNISAEELRVLPVGETVQDVMARQAGIVSSKDEYHVRGGRTDEVVYIIDGVKMKDALSGGSSGDLIGAGRWRR